MLWFVRDIIQGTHTRVYCHQIHTAMFLIWDPARVLRCFKRAWYVCVFSSGSFRLASARASFTWARLRPAPKVSPEMKSFVNNTMRSLLTWKCPLDFRLQIWDLYAGYMLPCLLVDMVVMTVMEVVVMVIEVMGAKCLEHSLYRALYWTLHRISLNPN